MTQYHENIVHVQTKHPKTVLELTKLLIFQHETAGDNTYQNCILHDVDRCEQHENRKQKCADGIDKHPWRFEEDDKCSQENAARLNKVRNDVNESSSNVHVLVAVLMARRLHFTTLCSIVAFLSRSRSMGMSMWRTTAVTMSMVMKRTTHSVLKRQFMK